MTDTLDGTDPAVSADPAASDPAASESAPAGPPETRTRLVRNPYLTVVQCTDDEVLLRHGARSRYSRVLRDDGRHRVLGPLLRAFERPRLSEDVVEPLSDRAGKEEIGGLIEQLAQDGVLVPEGSGTYQMYRSVIGGRPVRALEQAAVGLIGLGTVGSRLATQLAELGAGQVRGLAAGTGTGGGGGDGDGTFAAEAAGAGHPAVERLDGGLEGPEGEKALESLLDDSDLVVLALDGFRPSVLHRLNRTAVAAGRPWLPVYADGSELIVGPLVVPGESACYNEHEIQHESSRALRREFQIYSEELSDRTVDDLPPLLPPYASIAASWAAIGITSFLTDGSSFLVGRAIRVDFERLEITQEHVLRLPRCPVCTEHRPSFRHPFL